MRICALFGGPHKDGNTAKVLEQVLAGARVAHHTTVRINLIDLNIGYCRVCFTVNNHKVWAVCNMMIWSWF